MEEDFDDATMDACLVASGQRPEHYEMAAYGTLVAWAKALGHDDIATLLEQTPNEEKAADTKLTTRPERDQSAYRQRRRAGGNTGQWPEELRAGRRQVIAGHR